MNPLEQEQMNRLVIGWLVSSGMDVNEAIEYVIGA